MQQPMTYPEAQQHLGMPHMAWLWAGGLPRVRQARYGAWFANNLRAHAAYCAVETAMEAVLTEDRAFAYPSQPS